MSTVSKVQVNLKKNPYDELLDDLRKKLIESKPEDPVDFSIKILRAIQKMKMENDPMMKNGTLQNRQYEKPWLSSASTKTSKTRRSSVTSFDATITKPTPQRQPKSEVNVDRYNADRCDGDKYSVDAFSRVESSAVLDEDGILEKEMVRSFKSERSEKSIVAKLEIPHTSDSSYKRAMQKKNHLKTKNVQMINKNQSGNDRKDSGIEYSDTEELSSNNVVNFVTDIVTDSQPEKLLHDSNQAVQQPAHICSNCQRAIIAKQDNVLNDHLETQKSSLGKSLLEKSYQSFFGSDDEDIESASQVSGPRQPVWKSKDVEPKKSLSNEPLVSARSNQSIKSNSSKKNVTSEHNKAELDSLVGKGTSKGWTLADNSDTDSLHGTYVKGKKKIEDEKLPK